MFSIKKGCDIFQVRTKEWPKSSYGIVKLYGKRMALNASDSPVRYNLTVTKQIGGQMMMADIIRMVEKELPLTHLVLNSHGTFNSTMRAFVVNLGKDGLRNFRYNEYTETVNLFSKLRDKVKYIWIQSCGAGMDQELMSRLAENTNAYVIAQTMAIDGMRVPQGTIDWQLPAAPVVWNHARRNSAKPEEPIGQHLLWEVARQSADAKEFTNGLDFNLLRVIKVS